VQTFDKIPEGQKEPTGLWVNDYGGYISIGCDAKKIATCPVSFADLLKPEYKGKIAAYDPRPAGPGQAAAQVLWNRFGDKYIADLYKHQEITLTRDPRQLVEWVARGTHPIALGAVQIMIETFRKEKFPLAVIYPKDHPGFVTGGWSMVQLLKGGPNPNAGAVLANWLASKNGQEIYSKVMLEQSLRADVPDKELPEYNRPRPGVKYLDQYSNEWVAETWPKSADKIVELLGR
jgi:ABC-type Fe3+ transport system substrate-binding protein